MSDTPRTDEQINGKPCTRFEILAGDSLRNASVPSEFARELERELNAVNAEIERLRKANLQLRKGAEEQKQRIKQLEDWKQSALAVEREWDANTVATMLGAKLGESQRKVIQREVPLLFERIKRLEEAGDYLCAAAAFMGWHDKIETWNKAKEAK